MHAHIHQQTLTYVIINDGCVKEKSMDKKGRMLEEYVIKELSWGIF